VKPERMLRVMDGYDDEEEGSDDDDSDEESAIQK
jgi:hypothetical protein